MIDHRQDAGYTKVYQEDGGCVHVPLAGYADILRGLAGRMPTWEGWCLNGGQVWLRLDTVTAVLEVTPEMVETERALDAVNG